MIMMQILIVANNSSKDNGQVSSLHVLIVQISSILLTFLGSKCMKFYFFFSPFFLVVDCLCDGLYDSQIKRAQVMQENFLVGCKC